MRSGDGSDGLHPVQLYLDGVRIGNNCEYTESATASSISRNLIQDFHSRCVCNYSVLAPLGPPVRGPLCEWRRLQFISAVLVPEKWLLIGINIRLFSAIFFPSVNRSIQSNCILLILSICNSRPSSLCLSRLQLSRPIPLSWVAPISTILIPN